jgi:hypothetical protein
MVPSNQYILFEMNFNESWSSLRVHCSTGYCCSRCYCSAAVAPMAAASVAAPPVAAVPEDLGPLLPLLAARKVVSPSGAAL